MQSYNGIRGAMPSNPSPQTNQRPAQATHYSVVGLFLIGALWFVSACGSNATAPTTYPTVTAATIIPTVTVLPTTAPVLASTTVPVLPTNTVPPAPSSIPPPTSPTASSPPGAKPLQHCLEITPYRAGKSALQGRIVFSGNGWVSPSYLLDLKTGGKIILNTHADDVIRNMVVSPEGNWMAYRLDQFHPVVSKLIVADSNGRPNQIIPWDWAWTQLSGWLDSEHLWISRSRNPKPYVASDVLVVLNPFTREQKELAADLPGFSTGILDPGLGWARFNWSLLIYDPMLSKVLYPVNGYNLALWDVQHHQALAIVTGTASINVTPYWSPDGQQVLISGPATLLSSPTRNGTQGAAMELFTISRDGKIDRLTRLADVYTNADFGNYTWSPDGRYVALPLHVEPNVYPDLYAVTQQQTTNRLAVLDMATRTLTDYCVPDTTLEHPVWSPDGHQLVIEDPRTTTENNVFVVDLINNTAFSFAENATPIGWLTSNP